MTRFLPKRPRIRLDSAAYDKLRNEILERDGWRCQVCGSLYELEVHHMQRRSRQGDDSSENLITLCADCHRAIHAGSKDRTSSDARLALESFFGP